MGVRRKLRRMLILCTAVRLVRGPMANQVPCLQVDLWKVLGAESR